MLFRRLLSTAARPIPSTPSFFTARPVFYDNLATLTSATARAQQFLKAQHLLPLPAFARSSVKLESRAWKAPAELAVDMQTRLTTTRYRRVVGLLNTLSGYHSLARAAGCAELAERIEGVLTLYESDKKEALLRRGQRRPVVLDELKRSYTVGKRKTSAARVWMIPVVHGPLAETPTTGVLVNNLPLNEYFTPKEREMVVRPLKVAGLLGKYNVFAIVRGGGTAGQAGAVAHGVAKGIVAHEPALETLFRRAQLTRRDPRMVERKKTGRPKARKAYTWVKR